MPINIDFPRKNTHFFPKWDALKSVKYVSAAHINHDRRFRQGGVRSGGTNPACVFPININCLPTLTSQQGAFS
jgi:hypothetical protein